MQNIRIKTPKKKIQIYLFLIHDPRMFFFWSTFTLGTFCWIYKWMCITSSYVYIFQFPAANYCQHVRSLDSWQFKPSADVTSLPNQLCIQFNYILRCNALIYNMGHQYMHNKINIYNIESIKNNYNLIILNAKKFCIK